MEFFIIFFITTILFGIIGTSLTKRQISYETRIHKFLPRIDVTDKDLIEETNNKEKTYRKVLKKLAKKFKGKKHVEKWGEILTTANISISPEEFFVSRILLFLAVIIMGIVLQYPAFIIITFAIIGQWIPIFYIKKKREKRMITCRNQLPNVLSSMATSMKAGFSFMQALHRISLDTPDPIGTEFRKTIREINLGTSMEEAFKNLLERLPNEDLSMVINAVLIQRSTGGNLANILESIQHTIEERVRIKEELKALTAQGRLSGIVISLLPIGIGLFLNIINPGYFKPFFEHPIGFFMIGYGLFSGILGWILIQKMLQIEV